MARVSPEEPGGRVHDGAQVALNDLARILLGVRRGEHIPAADLVDRAGIPTINQIVVNQAAMAAWKATHEPGNPLSDLLLNYDGRTRGSSSNLKRPVSVRCVAATNMAAAWNLSEDLRAAETMSQARAVSKRIASHSRHA